MQGGIHLPNTLLCIRRHRTFNQQTTSQPIFLVQQGPSQIFIVAIHSTGPVLIITEVGDRECDTACSPSSDHTHVIQASLPTDGQLRADLSMQYIISYPRAR